MNTNAVTKAPTIEQFQAALAKGEAAIREAADMLCRMVDNDPKTYEKIHKATGIHWNVLGNLERVGRGAMHYKLLFDTSPAATKIQLLPASKQAEVYERGVQVVSEHGGKFVVEQKKAHELTPQQVKILFAPDHIRTVDEQMKEAAAKPKPKASFAAQRYIVEGDKLTILAATTFTMAQLEEILESMKSKEIKKLETKKKWTGDKW